MSYPRIYNAAVDMVDRNVTHGRGAKPAFIDAGKDSGETLTYGELQIRCNRMANLLGTYGDPARVPHRPAAAGYRGFSRGVLGGHQIGRRAGVPQHAADERAVRLHPGRQPRARTRHIGSSATGGAAHPRPAAVPQAHLRGGRRAAAVRALNARRSCSSRRRSSWRPTPAATRPRSGSTRRAPPACPRACATCTRAPWKRRGCAGSNAWACARTT